MTTAVDIPAQLQSVLKRYDRIGFGRRGVLDAEQEILRFASGLAHEEHARFRQIVMSWIEVAEAERVTAALHYNLPEHVRTLAIRLCGSVPIPESLPLLRRLQADGVDTTDGGRLVLDAIRDSSARLEAR